MTEKFVMIDAKNPPAIQWKGTPDEEDGRRAVSEFLSTTPPGKRVTRFPVSKPLCDHLKALEADERLKIWDCLLTHWLHYNAILGESREEFFATGGCLHFVLEEYFERSAVDESAVINWGERGDWEAVATALETGGAHPEIQKLAARIIRTKNRRKNRKKGAKRKLGTPISAAAHHESLRRAHRVLEEWKRGGNITKAKEIAASAFGRSYRQIHTDFGRHEEFLIWADVVCLTILKTAQQLAIRGHQLGEFSDEEAADFVATVREDLREGHPITTCR